jgi:archaetidylinositol phosphate synthase
MKREDFFQKWSAHHGGAQISGIVKAWLTISYRCARISSTLHISANVLTLLGVISAVAMVVSPLSLWCIPLLVLSLFADGIDGSVAMYQGRESAWGAILDSVADRITEALWLFVAYKIGVPAWIAIALWLIASTQEYMRARIASLGFSDIDVITPAERPVRASLLFILLVVYHLDFNLAVAFSSLFLLVQTFSAYLVARSAYRALSR